jgi:4-amino-4-deoxy-L-arabinose transferase-like glycosyltransferase
MAAIMAIFGTGTSGILAIKLAQALISAATVGLVFLLCVRLLKNRGAGLVAAALISFYPPMILYSRYLLTETLYFFFMVLYFIIQLHALEKKKASYNIAAGAIFAISVLVRPMIVVLLPLPYIYMYIVNKDKSERRLLIKNFIFFISAFVIVMLPWWIRNIIVLNQFIPLATQGNPFYAGIIRDYNSLPMSDNEFVDGIRLLLSELFSRPIQTITWFTVGKLEIIFFAPEYSLPSGTSYLSSLLPMHYYIVTLGSLGLLYGLFVKKFRMMSIYIIIYILLSLLFIPTRRFGLQYMPFLIINAVLVMSVLVENIRESLITDKNKHKNVRKKQ